MSAGHRRAPQGAALGSDLDLDLTYTYTCTREPATLFLVPVRSMGADVMGA